MAAFDTHAQANLTGRIGQAVSLLVASFNDWNEARMTRAALSDLSDRELDDIGLSRADVDALR